MTRDPARERLSRIALGHLVEPGSKALGELVRQCGASGALTALITGEAPGELWETAAPRLAGGDPYRLAGNALAKAERLGARILTPEDEEWPPQFADLIRISREDQGTVKRDTYPPQCVWVRGGWPLADVCDRSVAVVGARAATSYGRHVAHELAYGLADRGWTVVSGGAFGIDATAHRGALAAGGITMAVLACGIDRPYPVSHTGLFERIVDEGGLLLSEWPLGADPFKQRFLVRNRLIAAATRGTVVVEASLRSGARFTLGRARLLGRPALAVPGPVTSEMSEGCHEELRIEGTRLVTSVAQIIEEAGRIGDDMAEPARGADQPRDRLSDLEARILDGVMLRRVRTAEEVAVASGVSSRDARRVLPALAELGFVDICGTGYRLAKPERGPEGGVTSPG